MFKVEKKFSISKHTLNFGGGCEGTAWCLTEKDGSGGYHMIDCDTADAIATRAIFLGATAENTTWPFCKKEIAKEKSALSRIGMRLLGVNSYRELLAK